MDLLAAAAAAAPGAPALVTRARTVSYAELDAAATGVADLVTATGSLGTRAVAFWGDRTIEAIAAVWGVPRAGVAAVPIDPRMPPALAMDATRSAGVRGLWTPPDGGFDRLVERGRGRIHDGVGEYVVLTSGSEAAPKGVRLTPGNVAAAVAASQDRLGNRSDDPWLCVLPLFHVGGLAILWRQAATAAPVHLEETFEASRVAAALHEVSYASFVPVMLRRVLDAGGSGHTGLRAVLVGGAAADGILLERARSVGIPAIPTYGMTETCSQIATPSPSDPLDGTVGPALEGAEIGVGDDGRIAVRGPMVSPGYVGSPERPADAWFTTGDLGRWEGDRLVVVGRADSVIVTGGENVHPETVAGFLRSHDRIVDARVFGVPDPEWGEIVVAEVETSLDPVGLDAAAASLPPHMRPRRWEIVATVRRKLDV